MKIVLQEVPGSIHAPQLRDEKGLLDLMLEDAQAVPEVYQPTNYWTLYNTTIVSELYEQGLHDFRRRKATMLHKFNAVERWPSPRFDIMRFRMLSNRYTRRIPWWRRLLFWLTTSQNSLKLLRVYHFMKEKASEIGAVSLERLEASLAGNPEQIININGRVYTHGLLQCYLDYLYCSQFIHWDTLEVLVELGSGSGKQIEVLKKAHPHVCFLVFDTPPQLYVCERYLATVFPASVVSYRVTRTLTDLPKERAGKIFVFGNWRLPVLQKLPVDLFWSCATFQEMEPFVVEHYLSFVRESCRALYLSQTMGGKKRARRKGEPGVLTPTTLEHYKTTLENFELVDMTKRWSLEPTDLHNSFWRRQSGIDGHASNC